MKVTIRWTDTTVYLRDDELGIVRNRMASQGRWKFEHVYNVVDESKFMLAVIKYDIEYYRVLE
jgi:hypothetical protein